MIARCARPALLAALVVYCTPLPARAQPADLGLLSLEELMKIEITSASRKQQSIASIPAAVHVITADDIRRSGLTTLPDLLRLAPGVQVARINANKWAVSIRGFNGLYSTKLLVLVDGRAVYSRFYSGVLWDAEDIALEEIERIEIIRGPGGAMWGTNAVNGVVNVVTRSTAAAAGTVVRTAVGTFDRGLVAASHGGGTGATTYRVHSRWAGTADTRIAGAAAGDSTASWRTGGRVERDSAAGKLLFDGQFGGGWQQPLWLAPSFDAAPALIGGESRLQDGVALARFTRKGSGDRTLQLQGSFEAVSRKEPIGHYTHRAGDVDVQYHIPGGRHDLVVGGAHRLIAESLTRTLDIRLDPPTARESIFSAFLQDDIRMGPALVLTLGGRLEKLTDLDWQVQPTARASWRIAERQHLWGAISRASRTPSLQERRIRIAFEPVDVGLGLPLATQMTGNPDLKPETVVSAEAGYRASAARVELDVSMFRSRYSDLRSMEPRDPEIHVGPSGPFLLARSQFENLFAATTAGLEILARYRPSSPWRAEAGLTLFDLTPKPNPQSRDAALARYDGAAANAQAFVRGAYTARADEIDLFLSMVGRLESTDVPAYARLDLRWERRLADGLWVAVVGRNLLHAEHTEGDRADFMQLPTAMPRNGSVQLRWRIR